jgi:hypothetical protein
VYISTPAWTTVVYTSTPAWTTVVYTSTQTFTYAYHTARVAPDNYDIIVRRKCMVPYECVLDYLLMVLRLRDKTSTHNLPPSAVHLYQRFPPSTTTCER